MRFPGAILETYDVDALIFQFSLWDSPVQAFDVSMNVLTFNSLYEIHIVTRLGSAVFVNLSILFMRFRLTQTGPNGHSDTNAFNSLYEILNNRPDDPTLWNIFQFSLWDSVWHPILPIGFWHTFNSLYEILLYYFVVFKPRVNFQFSLWDSLAAIGKAILPTAFQFSLWDSKSRPRSKSPSKLSILFMRFLNQGVFVGLKPKITFNSLYEIQ